jgi:hypothetical protein
MPSLKVVGCFGQVLGVVFEQWLEGSVVGLVVSCAEPVEHVVSLPSPDGA